MCNNLVDPYYFTNIYNISTECRDKHDMFKIGLRCKDHNKLFSINKENYLVLNYLLTVIRFHKTFLLNFFVLFTQDCDVLRLFK